MRTALGLRLTVEKPLIILFLTGFFFNFFPKLIILWIIKFGFMFCMHISMNFEIFIRVFVYVLRLVFVFSSKESNELIRVGSLLIMNFFDCSWIVDLFYGQVREFWEFFIGMILREGFVNSNSLVDIHVEIGVIDWGEGLCSFSNVNYLLSTSDIFNVKLILIGWRGFGVFRFIKRLISEFVTRKGSIFGKFGRQHRRFLQMLIINFDNFMNRLRNCSREGLFDRFFR